MPAHSIPKGETHSQAASIALIIPNAVADIQSWLYSKRLQTTTRNVPTC